MPIRCVNGHDNDEVASFCSKCGVPLGGESAPAENASSDPTRPAPAASDGPSASSSTISPAVPAPPAPTVNSAHSNRPKILWAVGTSLLLAAVAIGVVLTLNDEPGKADGTKIRGIALLLDTDGVDGSWDSCEGNGGYDDFSAGMRLSVKGANDEIVGSGDVDNVTEENLDEVAQAELDSDDVIGLDADNLDDAKEQLRDFLKDGEGMMCSLYFEADVEPSDYYSVELGNRGDLSYSRDELKEQGFVVGITLGEF